LKQTQIWILAIAAAVLLTPALGAKKGEPGQIEIPKTEEKPEGESPAETPDTQEPVGIPTEEIPTIESETTIQPDAEADDAEPAEKTRRDTTPPPVLRDLNKLPKPVRRMYDLLLTTAPSGNIEKLRDLIGVGDTATTLSIGGLEGDPIAFLKEASGDAEGFEILAILTEVLETGYVHLDAGTDEELYVWPYFMAWPLDKLTPEMKVELYSVLTAGDVEDSQNFGGYIFYRVGIKPDGTWSFFVAGD